MDVGAERTTLGVALQLIKLIWLVKTITSKLSMNGCIVEPGGAILHVTKVPSDASKCPGL